MLLNETKEHSSDGLTGYKNVITEEQAIELIKKHCKNVDPQKPLYRGMKSKYGEYYYMIEASKGNRVSANTSNHYTLIIDHLLGNNPLRSKSIICTNDLKYTYIYGDAFVVFPYDDVEIGKCEYDDIWINKVSFNGVISGDLPDVNDILQEVVPSPKSYADIVNGLAKFLDDESNADKKGDIGKLYDAFKDMWSDWDDGEEWSDVDKKDVVEGVLEQVYDPEHSLGMEFGTYKELEIDELDTDHEFWFGGKCIVIENNTYKKMLREGMFE